MKWYQQGTYINVTNNNFFQKRKTRSITTYFFSVNKELTARAQQFGIILDDISITHLTFGREFTQAVELKQVAQQEAEKARFLVEKAEQIKKANVISAEGDSAAADLIASAMGKAGEGLVELRRIGKNHIQCL